MNLQPASLYNLVLIGASIITASLASWFIYQQARGSKVFALLMLALGWWTCAYAQELSSTDLSTALLWGKLEYLSIIAVPPLWLIFGRNYAGHDWGAHPLSRLGLWVVPLITLGLVWTSESHGLVWSSIAQHYEAGFNLLVIGHGPWFWVHAIYSYTLIIGGSVLLLSAAWRAAPTYRHQSVALVIAALLPLAGNVIYLARLTPVAGLDLTPLLFTASAVLFAWAASRSHIFTIGPVARNRLVEEMADVVLVLDEHGLIADINPAGRRLVGAGHVFGRRLAVVAPSLAVYLLADAPPSELSVGEGEAARAYDVQYTLLKNRRGARSGTLIVLREITLRKQVERRLRSQKELFAALATLAHAATARPTLPETLQGILRAAAELTGASHGSILLFEAGSTMLQSVFVHGAGHTVTELRCFERVVAQGLAGWAVQNQDIALAHDIASDPRWLDLPERTYPIGSALAVPVLQGGQALGVITLTHSEAHFFQPEQAELMSAAASQIGLAVRNAQMYEAQRQLAERAEAASRAKSTFLATVSHELRTPLNIIIGYGELLAEDLEEHELDTMLSHLLQITGAGRQLLGMVNDILELSHAEAGQTSLDLGPVTLVDLASHVVALARPLAAQNHNLLELDCPDDLGVISTDHRKLRSILLHLLSNACKFTEHGHIILTLRREADGEVVFQIADTGIGIAEDQLPQLFAHFTQVDGSSTRRYGGVGLGLALSQHFCRLLGGEISVQSRFGHGSTFTLRLPVVPGKEVRALGALPK